MHLNDREIREYFGSRMVSFWDWQEHGEVLAWADGGTIVFRLEVTAILERFLNAGWPRFGSLVLLMGATRASWTQSAGIRPAFHEFLSHFHQATDAYQLMVDVLRGLDNVNSMRDLVTSTAAKAELAALVLESSPNRLSAQLSTALHIAICDGFSEGQVAAYADDVVDSLLADLRCLHAGLKQLDRPTFELRLRTGLDQPVEALLVDIPPGEAVRALIRQHTDDETIGGVLRLAKWLMVAVQLPRPLSDPEDLPVGGITDISNRGPLDRLLLSELAHDDLTLAVRVAMNEALFLRREPLARQQPRQRIVVLDSGLRMWGVPRVFGTAVGLAMAAQGTEQIDVQVYRAAGKRLTPVDFTTAGGVSDHLAALDHRLHPGEAMNAVTELAGASTVSSDVVVVTNDEVADDANFLRAARAAGLGAFHLCAVNRDGEFRLVQHSPRGQKLIKQARYALEEVLNRSRKSSPKLIDSRVDDGRLPAIMGLDTFPLRLSTSVKLDNSWHISTVGVLTLTSDSRLLLWDEWGSGARQLAYRLPAGKLHWCTSTPQSGVVTAVLGKLSRRGLYAWQWNVDTNEQSMRRLDVSLEYPQRVYGHSGVIFVHYLGDVDALDPTTGALLDSRQLGERLSRRGRFALEPVRASNTPGAPFQTQALSYDGTRIQLTAIQPGQHSIPRDVFDADRIASGPVGFMPQGELCFLGSDERQKLNLPANEGPWELAALSRDGMRMALKSKTSAAHTHFFLVYVATGTAHKTLGDPKVAVESAIFSQASTRVMRHRFASVGLDAEGRLVLVTRRKSYWPICYRLSAIVLPSDPSKVPPRQPLRDFRRLDLDRGYDLSLAEFPDGSRVLLDSRGLLHLQSSERSIPEITIVLCEGATAGWASDGRFWGPSYFTGDAIPADAKDIYEQILQPFVNRLS